MSNELWCDRIRLRPAKTKKDRAPVQDVHTRQRDPRTPTSAGIATRDMHKQRMLGVRHAGLEWLRTPSRPALPASNQAPPMRRWVLLAGLQIRCPRRHYPQGRGDWAAAFPFRVSPCSLRWCRAVGVLLSRVAFARAGGNEAPLVALLSYLSKHIRRLCVGGLMRRGSQSIGAAGKQEGGEGGKEKKREAERDGRRKHKLI